MNLPPDLLERASDVVRVMLGDACHDMDVTPKDREPDRLAWERIQSETAVLLATAYLRNHDH